MIYRAIVKRKARGIFAALSNGEWQATTMDLADNVHHVFAGEGAHWIRLRWGKGVEVHGYLDTARLDVVLERLAAAGVEEASAPPISG